MQQRSLGAQRLEVSALGLGCMGMSMAYGPKDDAQSLTTLKHALDRGITLFDMAELYGAGHNESLLAKAIKGRRDEAVISTKFGIRPGDDGKNVMNGAPDYVRMACDRSLQALGTDTIDIYFQHRVDPKNPIEDTMGALAGLVEAGKVRHVGLSEAAPDIIRRAHAVHPLTALQSEYSLWSRDVEEGVLPLCRELGIGFVAYSPLSRGFLGGTIHSPQDVNRDGDIRPRFPRYQTENFDANRTLVDALAEFAAIKACTVAQLALAWVMAQGPDIVPIVGTRAIERVNENVGAVDLQLSENDLATIDEICPPGSVVGARVPGTSRISK